MSSRLPVQPGEVIARSKSLSFSWNGKLKAQFSGADRARAPQPSPGHHRARRPARRPRTKAQ